MDGDARIASGIVGDAAGRTSLASSPPFLTVRELALVLRIGKNQAYALVNTGQVAACRIGTAIRVPRVAVERWVDAQQSATPNGGGKA